MRQAVREFSPQHLLEQSLLLGGKHGRAVAHFPLADELEVIFPLHRDGLIFVLVRFHVLKRYLLYNITLSQATMIRMMRT